MPRVRLLPLLLALAACDCGPGVQDVLPMLEIDTEDVDFGAVAVGDTVTQTVRLSAGTSADLTLAVTLEDDGHGAYTIDPPPETIPGSGSVTLTIHFLPPAIETYVATLDIRTNDPDTARGHKRVLIQGQGLAPRIEVTPAALSLGAVACPPRASPPAACVDRDDVVVANVGEVRLTIGDVTLRGRDGEALPENLRFMNIDVAHSTLEPDETVKIGLQWQPSSALGQFGEFEAELVIESNAPERRELVVPLTLTGRPNSPPTACIELEEITRREYQRQPDGRVVVRTVAAPYELTASNDTPPVLTLATSPGSTPLLRVGPSCTGDDDDDVLSLAWGIERLDGAEMRVTPLRGGDGARIEEILEAGRSRVTLLVSDGVNPPVSRQLVVDAVPREDLFVQVGWPDASGANVDLDLHLVLDEGPGVEGPGDLFCDQDAFFFNPGPNWFDELKVADDPRYLRDDTGGGVRIETLSLAEVPDGASFRVAVHYFDYTGSGSDPAQRPVVRGRLRGGVEFEVKPDAAAGAPLAGVGDVWFAARLAFPAGSTEGVVTVLDAPGMPRYPRGDVPYDGSLGVCDP